MRKKDNIRDSVRSWKKFRSKTINCGGLSGKMTNFRFAFVLFDEGGRKFLSSVFPFNVWTRNWKNVRIYICLVFGHLSFRGKSNYRERIHKTVARERERDLWDFYSVFFLYLVYFFDYLPSFSFIFLFLQDRTKKNKKEEKRFIFQFNMDDKKTWPLRASIFIILTSKCYIEEYCYENLVERVKNHLRSPPRIQSERIIEWLKYKKKKKW